MKLALLKCLQPVVHISVDLKEPIRELHIKPETMNKLYKHFGFMKEPFQYLM